MRFSTAAGIETAEGEDWFDPVMEQDSPLYIDPFLVFDDKDPLWVGSYDRVVEFFETAAELVLASGGVRNTPAWRKASGLLRFPEPHEFALGVSLGSPRGAGTGEKFAGLIADILSLLGKSKVERLTSIGGFALFCDGIGPDRISDIVSNILKDRFIDYTNQVIGRHQVATELVSVQHLSWEPRRGWKNGELPLFPNVHTGGGVLLTPHRFLKDLPRIEPEEFWDWAEIAETAVLRDNLSFDLSESLSESAKVARARRLAWAAPEIALEYLQRFDEASHSPYDVGQDPRGLVGWYEAGLKVMGMIPADAPSSKAPATEAEFQGWVRALVADFKHAVEDAGAWRLLWNQDYTKPNKEEITQVAASVTWRGMCRAADVMLGRELNIGRGPVDFMFARGWSKRAAIEFKHIKSTKFWAGAAKQLPQYMKSEEVDFGVYVAVAFDDKDLEPDRITRVEDTIKAFNKDGSRSIELVIIDARPKQSASKL